MKNEGGQDGDLLSKGFSVVNDVDGAFSSLEVSLEDDKKTISKLYKDSLKNKKEVAHVLHRIQSVIDDYNKYKCSVLSKDLKLVDLAYEDIQSKDHLFQVGIYLDPSDSKKYFRLRVEFERYWEDDRFGVKKRLCFKDKIFSADVEKVMFECKGNVHSQNKRYTLNFEDSLSRVCYYDKAGNIIKNFDEIGMQEVGGIYDYRHGMPFPWYDFTWDGYDYFYKNKKWFYKQNSKEVMKTFLDAVNAAKMSSKIEHMKSLLG